MHLNSPTHIKLRLFAISASLSLTTIFNFDTTTTTTATGLLCYNLSMLALSPPSPRVWVTTTPPRPPRCSVHDGWFHPSVVVQIQTTSSTTTSTSTSSLLVFLVVYHSYYRLLRHVFLVLFLRGGLPSSSLRWLAAVSSDYRAVISE